MAARPFGKYEVLARLATGGAASIFLARQAGVAGFSKLVCLKTLLPERARDEDFVAMFLDEARLAARLNHPNCVQIYDLGCVRGVYYISMEYIFGETLWSLLTTVAKTKTPLPAPHVAHAIASVCDGLQHAHDLKDKDGKPYNLVHRDVSPQNVMVSYEGQTKVVDFGIAKAETDRAPTMAGIVKGKFSYMSPEQITGESVDRRSDIYSLGIVMFECLASRLYRGETPEDIARLILEHRAPRLAEVVPGIPAELDEICAKALARRRENRYQTALEMGEDIRSYLDSIGHRQSASGLSGLLQERFADVIKPRRVAVEAASQLADYDEAELLKALDAVAVREVDLFTEEAEEEGPRDFTETAISEPFAAPLDDEDPDDAEAAETLGVPGKQMVELISSLSQVTDGEGLREVTEFEPDRREVTEDEGDDAFDYDYDSTRADDPPYEDESPTNTSPSADMEAVALAEHQTTQVPDPAEEAKWDVGTDAATRVDSVEPTPDDSPPSDEAPYFVPEAISMPVVAPLAIASSTRKAVSPARAFVDGDALPEDDFDADTEGSSHTRRPVVVATSDSQPEATRRLETGVETASTLSFAPSVVVGALVMGLLIGLVAGLLLGRALFVSDEEPIPVRTPRVVN